MTVQVTIDAADAESLDQLVSDGSYASREEALHDAIRLAREEAAWHAMVRAKIEEGRAQLARGEGIPIEEVMERLTERYRNWPS